MENVEERIAQMFRALGLSGVTVRPAQTKPGFGIAIILPLTGPNADVVARMSGAKTGELLHFAKGLKRERRGESRRLLSDVMDEAESFADEFLPPTSQGDQR